MSRTKRESLKGCAKMWSWLAQTGCREKHKWPPLFKFGYIYYTCFACDWVWAQGVRPGDMKECAKICPLKNLWPEGCETNEGNSPYDHWRNAKNLEDSKSMLP
jgi:hypothetical protein